MTIIERLRLAEQRRKDAAVAELTETIHSRVSIYDLPRIYHAIDVASLSTPDLDASLESANLTDTLRAYIRALN